jgi:cytoskeletal protein RodZ
VIEIGASLTQARLRRRLGIAEAAKATRLREHYLHALEGNRFDELPHGSYRRAFLRTYATYLALDAALLIDEYVARYERERDKSPRTASLTLAGRRRSRR